MSLPIRDLHNMNTRLTTGWEGHSDAELLCALAKHDEHALRELHRRYAPCLYALAAHHGHQPAEPQVQRALLSVMQNAHCHARTSLDARHWIVAVAQRALSTPQA